MVVAPSSGKGMPALPRGGQGQEDLRDKVTEAALL